ncbi:hypothetical protein DdX_15582 [Ditylenchus destructor]|uniref:Uncharacterized protein n=1 Tax=Ditylenchus destructor TaxID=166010 RepID=A0AAD4MV19_9BILA|nr:hypothetical protein DdX_15582 [Ditylenchus destructor]
MLNHLRFINRRPDRVTLPGPRRVAIQCTTVHVLPLPWTLWQLLHNGAGRDRLCEIVSPDFLVHTYPPKSTPGSSNPAQILPGPATKVGKLRFFAVFATLRIQLPPAVSRHSRRRT